MKILLQLVEYVILGTEKKLLYLVIAVILDNENLINTVTSRWYLYFRNLKFYQLSFWFKRRRPVTVEQRNPCRCLFYILNIIYY